jgi:hypothetical protein
MGKRVISVSTLVFFVVFLVSCTSTSYQKTKVNVSPDSSEAKSLRVLGIQTTSGDYIEFLRDPAAQIGQYRVQGYRAEKVTIDKSMVNNVTQKDKALSEIITQDGKRYLIYSTSGNQYTCYEYISVPNSEVELVSVERVSAAKKVSALKTTALVIGVGLAAVLTAGLIALATKESCPFIYSFDGGKYIFDAEPYGGAICERLKRTEWCGLENIREIKGQYKILVTNEVNETQYTDELKLVVVDHPKDRAVVPDRLGQFHSISQPIVPSKANDSRGQDLLPFVSKNDRIFWQTRIEEKSPDRKKDLRDELTFEFPKPEGVKKAKLIVNACNTLWGSQSLKRYLELYGNKVNEWYDELKKNGPAFYRMVKTHTREELYSLQIRVETEKGWISKGLIIGGGPFVSEDKIYLLDISDVSGEVLKIKLTPPAAFWMINYLAVDYSEDIPVLVREVEALKALDDRGRDVKETLTKEDNNYLIMPDTGNSAELIFPCPPRQEGLARTVVLKASGYYDIHLEAKGEPRMDVIERFVAEPGYIVEYAFQEYLKWNADLAKMTSQRQ